VNGEVVLFADVLTGSIRKLIAVCERRRSVQEAYNREHGITPKSVSRAVQESLHVILKAREVESSVVREAGGDFDRTELLRELEAEMERAAGRLEYEKAALLRDQIRELRGGKVAPRPKPEVRYGKSKRRG
jgi:excinuclease ABC subunit B